MFPRNFNQSFVNFNHGNRVNGFMFENFAQGCSVTAPNNGNVDGFWVGKHGWIDKALVKLTIWTFQILLWNWKEE